MMEETNQTLLFKDQMRAMKRLLTYLKPYKVLLVSALGLMFLMVVADLSGPLIIKDIIDNYIVTEKFNDTGMLVLVAMYVGVSALYTFFNYFATMTFHKIGNRITQDIRVDLFSSLQTLGMRYFDQTPVGSIVSRVTNDTEAIQDMFINVISVVVTSLAMIIGILIVMFSLNPTLALISMMFIPVALFFIYLYQKYSTKHYQLAREKNSQINTRISESISGMKIIQDFNQQDRFVDEFSDLNNEYYEASLMNMKIDGLLLAPVIHVLTAIALAIVIYYSGLLSLQGTIMVGAIFAFVELIYRLFDPMFQIMDRLSLYQQAVVAGDRIFKIIDNDEKTPSQNSGASAQIKEAKVEFKNVSFSYDGKHQVLKDISFVVNPGETIALVGHTGSGKSSIINVMMRFYEFFEGEILIDDISIKEYPMEHLRKKMGLVLQDPFIYFGTIADNIRLLNNEISDEAIEAAAKFVQADDFINALDDGYNHAVIEEGAAFSTGQKQLLAFARAIVTDPKILILDEATANVDTETEVLIQEGLERIRQGRTNIMIAHRLSTIRDANQILVMEQGEIVERGNHEELMRQKGLYHAMVELQKSDMEFEDY